MNDQRATRKQQELLQFVDAFIREHGYGPSYREVMNGIGYKSVSTVAAHIEGLIAKGYLNRRDNTARSLEVVTMNAELPRNVKTSTVVDEVTRQLEKSSERAEQDVLLKALELLGYKAESERLKKEHEANTVTPK